MISLQEIESFYPENQRAFKRGLLREYLQYKVLQIVFNSKVSEKLCFIGGTALKIVYGNSRFSEDLDFDNFGLSKKEFETLPEAIKKDLELEGYNIEIRNVYKKAFHCYIKFPRLLHYHKLSGYEEEKILIQVDTISQDFRYAPQNYILNKFDVFTQIKVASLDILLSQKIFTAFDRKTPKGRDFYDISFLFAKTRPNYGFLKEKCGVENSAQLKKYLLKKVSGINFKLLARDVEGFLINPQDVKRILLFTKYIKTVL